MGDLIMGFLEIHSGIRRNSPKFLKHDFEIMVDPKGVPSEPTFWLGL